MKILAIHDGHNSTICYLQKGKLISLISEERFTNIKNQGGFPRHSVEWILESNGLKWADLDAVIFPHLIELIEYGRNKNTSPARAAYDYLSRFLPRSLLASPVFIGTYSKYMGFPQRRRTLLNYAKDLGFSPAKIVQVEHHTSHAYAAIYGSGFQDSEENILVFTCDASGDGVSSTVGTWNKRQKYNRIYEGSSFDSIGTLYAAVTRLLGMRPNEHEYKIMGMAPYVDKEYAADCCNIFMKFVNFDEHRGGFVNHRSFGESQLSELGRDLYMKRFDSICGGLQMHFEQLICKWVDFWAAKTGCRTAVFGGGSFMNVKGNMLIAKSERLDRLFFCPSSGDESTALGAAYYAAERGGETTIAPLANLYLGNEFTNDEIECVLANHGTELNYSRLPDIELQVARLLADRKIVARFSGRAEWGARALGNRSILCRADDLKIINKLNKSIKMRDFWMPFASSILDEDSGKYFSNPKNIDSSFMIVTFDTTETAQEEITAGLHPFDFTCRPQTVSENSSPKYWRLLREYRRLTGQSGILNTSFNLHGYPIVGTPEIAVKTLLESKIDYLAIGDYIVEVRGRSSSIDVSGFSEKT